MRTMRLLGLCAVLIGFWLMVAPMLVFPHGHWRNLVNDVTVGSLVVGAGLWRAYGTRGANWSTASLAVLGLMEFVSPWLYDQTLRSARWNAWVIGALLMLLAAVINSYHPKDKPLHFTLVPDIIPTDPIVPFRQREAGKPARPRRERPGRQKGAGPS